MNNNLILKKYLPVLDYRTLFDLNLKEIGLRYLTRVITCLFMISLLISYGYTKINPILGWVLLIFITLLGISILIALKLLGDQIKYFGKNQKRQEILNDVNNIIERLEKLPDIERKKEIKKARYLLNLLTVLYKKSNEIDRLIICKRYEASLMLHVRNFSKALSEIESVDNYFLNLPDELKKNKEVRAEIAKVWVMKATIFEATEPDKEKTFELLDRALQEFQSLNLEKEIKIVLAIKERIGRRKKIR